MAYEWIAIDGYFSIVSLINFETVSQTNFKLQIPGNMFAQILPEYHHPVP